MTIQTQGELKTAEEFNRMVISRDGDRVVRLRDIGEAREGVKDERTRARQMGRPCIFLGVIKNSKANTVDVAKGIKREVEAIQPTLPEGVQMVVAYDESVYVERAISEVWESLAIAFGLVVVVIYVFLHNFRATLIPAVAVPVSIVANFTVMYWMGFSVNILTMLALVLAIGVVVDDAIVVLENIHRHIEEGLSPMDAAFKGMKEITFAVIATTVALVAVFTPLAFQTSSTGRLFVEFAIAIAGSVLISAFVALTLTPMMAGRILQRVEKKPGSLVRAFEVVIHAMTRVYERTLGRLLGWSLGVRMAFLLLIGGGVSGATFWLWKGLEGDFLPEEDKGRLFCFVIAPEGSTPEYTDRMVRQAEGILAKTPEVELYGALVAPGFSGPGQGNSGMVFVKLKDERERSVQQVVNAPGGIRQNFFRDVEGAIAIPSIPKAIDRGFGSPFQLVLQGNDLDKLNVAARDLANKLRA
jgi:multidrug efflux pump subunit AcrB